ncbi:MAG: DUF3772 domain-containing protein [Hyphomonadaceae bacterium]
MPKQLNWLGLICFFIFVLSSAVVAGAQEPSTPQNDAIDTLQERSTSLQLASELIGDVPANDLLELRETIRDIRQREEAAIVPLRNRLEEARLDRDRLTPADESANLAPEIEQRRRELSGLISDLEADIVQADINIVEANRLLIDIAELRRRAFYSRVLERDRPPFRPSAMTTLAGSFVNDRQTFSDRVGSWRDDLVAADRYGGALASLIFSALFALFMLGPVPRRLDRALIERMKKEEPTPSRRVAAAGLRVIIRAVPAFIGATVFYQVASGYGLVTPDTSKLVGACLLAFATLFVIWDVTTAVFAPKLPQWRLIPLNSERARGVRFIIMAIAVVFSADAVLRRLAEWLGSSREVVTLSSAIVLVIGGVLLFLLARPQLWRLDAQGRETFSSETLSFWKWMRNLAGLFAILMIFATVTGYVSLARFGMTRLYFLSYLLTGAWFARALLYELAGWFDRTMVHTEAGSEAPTSGPKDEKSGLLLFWFRLLVDFGLLVIITPMAFLVLGVDRSDLRNWVFDALFGFQVGGFTFSIANILTALGVLIGVLLLTRLIQRVSDKRIFEPTRMDSGLRNTLRTLIGYSGLVIAIGSAFGVLGFPWANLAIVAGALSLGIGFGLQSIVNNFVSGLILLFERPIKVGDWVETAAGEGIVKRISVRSTEIETFDWASIIVPNSELVTLPVTNWTHKNKYTRILIPVGVSYKADPETVAEILMKCAKASPRALSYPLPVIFFAGYGDSSLDFEVRVFINSVDDRIPVQNDLRFAIFTALKEAGIEIPFPQRDLHVHTMKPGTTFTAKPDVVDGDDDNES